MNRPVLTLELPEDIYERVRRAAKGMIASVALVHDLTLVTHNTADYRNIPGIRLDDWLLP